MKILNCAISSLFVVIMGVTTGSSADYDIQKLTTKFGKVYHEVIVLDADEYGLLFRHSNGVAKESFGFLSIPLRDMFEPVDDIPSLLVPTETEATSEPDTTEVPMPEMVLTLRVRKNCVVQPVKQNCRPYPNCHFHPTPCNWPSHWHKFHHAHYLTNPRCRELAIRSFLNATGLLPGSREVQPIHFAGPASFHAW